MRKEAQDEVNTMLHYFKRILSRQVEAFSTLTLTALLTQKEE